MADFTHFKRKSNFFNFGNHFAPGKPTQIATNIVTWAIGILLAKIGKVISIMNFPTNLFRFGFCFFIIVTNKNMRATHLFRFQEKFLLFIIKLFNFGIGDGDILREDRIDVFVNHQPLFQKFFHLLGCELF